MSLLFRRSTSCGRIVHDERNPAFTRLWRGIIHKQWQFCVLMKTFLDQQRKHAETRVVLVVLHVFSYSSPTHQSWPSPWARMSRYKSIGVSLFLPCCENWYLETKTTNSWEMNGLYPWIASCHYTKVFVAPVPFIFSSVPKALPNKLEHGLARLFQFIVRGPVCSHFRWPWRELAKVVPVWRFQRHVCTLHEVQYPFCGFRFA